MAPFVPLRATAPKYRSGAVSPPPQPAVVAEPPAPAPPTFSEADLALAVAEARAAGRAEGEAAAQRASQVELDRLRAQLAAVAPLIDEIPRAKARALQDAQAAVGAVVVASVRKIVGDALALDPAAISTLCERALARVPEDEVLHIRVPPRSAEAIQSLVEPGQRARVIADPSLDLGVIIETPYGAVESSAALAVAGVEEAVKSWLAGRS